MASRKTAKAESDTVSLLLCIEARARIKARKRLNQSHYEAVRDSERIPAEAKRKLLAANHALMMTAALGGKHLTPWDHAYLKKFAPGVSVVGPVSAADRVASSVSRHNTIKRKTCVDPKRRKRLERNPQAWLKYYLAGAYSRPFEQPHKEIIKGVTRAHDTQGRFVVAAERGVGKSALLWGMILYLSMSGRQPYPVCVPWASAALKRAFRFWKTALCFNELLLADYPEYCQPFAAARGVAQRVPNIIWSDTTEATGAQLTVGEGMIILPDNLGCIGGSTINGNIRGLNHPQHDGTILRPSIVVVDDVQDRSVAKSQVQVAETIAIIESDVAGCGETGRDLPMLLACNCIAPNDVAEHYLTDPNWQALRVSCIEHWPDGWDDDKSEARRLWDEWHDRFLSGAKDQAFYRKNKAGMTKGMKLSAPAAFKGSEKCPDAFYGVIRMWFRMGREAFMAERQQRPVDPVSEAGPYTLNPAIIQSRADKNRKQFAVPSWVTRIRATTDVNPSYAFSTVVLGFGEDQTAAVLWYGLHKLSIPGETPATELAKALFEQLTIHGKELAGLPMNPGVWAIDAGGAQFDPVIRFAEESARICGIPAHGFRGGGARYYRPWGKSVSGTLCEQCHGCLDRKLGRNIRWVAWNADYWKEVAQRAWLGEIGSPGSVSLYAGTHSEFSTQVCGDKLMGKGDIGGQVFWNYHRTPGRNDFGDAMAQGYALAAYYGIGTSGRVEVSGRKKYRQSDLSR